MTIPPWLMVAAVPLAMLVAFALGAGLAWRAAARHPRRPAAMVPSATGAPTTDAAAAQQLRLLVDHMPDGVFAYDAARRVRWINPAARQTFQVGAAEAVGRPMADFIDEIPEAVNRARPDLAETLLEPTTTRHLMRGRRSDGQTLVLEMACITLGAGPDAGGLCVCRDVSEGLRIERMQREFVSMVSHELRTPLTSLRGALALLGDGSFGRFEPDAERLLRMAGDNAERLVVLVNDILDFEKLRAGALTVELGDEDLLALARQAVDAIEGMARQAGVRIELAADEDEQPVLADPARVAQVLANLLSNAIKHTPPQGRVWVQIERGSERVRLSVRDSGPGVPPEFVPRLFEPFQQATDPQRRRQGGTGLGLAISRGLMEMMHGAIGVEPPRAGKGACFWIELPLNWARPSTFGELPE